MIRRARRHGTASVAAELDAGRSQRRPAQVGPTTQDDPSRTDPDDFGDECDASSVMVTRAFVPDAREREAPNRCACRGRQLIE